MAEDTPRSTEAGHTPSNHWITGLSTCRTPMARALGLARKAAALGEVPVGAVVVHNGEVIAEAHNLTETNRDPSAHAELLAIRAVCAKLGTPRIADCDLYVTLEPCAMCAAAISFARVRRLYFGAFDPKGGAVDHGPRFFSQSICHHAPEILGGMMEQECGEILREFFSGKRG